MADETPEPTPFKATVRRAYSIEARQVVLILERYEGDTEVGDWVEVAQRDGTRAAARVASVAWGSAFHADSPPLTLVVTGLAGAAVDAGADVIGIPPRPSTPQ
jgi:hypothetical protein